MPWHASGRLTNPAANAVLVDTGPLPAASRSYALHLGGTGAVVVEVQWRNAANTSTLRSQIYAAPSNTVSQTPPPPQGSEFDMSTDERLRVVTVNNPNGDVSVSLFVTQ